jgi:hypothetical protein
MTVSVDSKDRRRYKNRFRRLRALFRLILTFG